MREVREVLRSESSRRGTVVQGLDCECVCRMGSRVSNEPVCGVAGMVCVVCVCCLLV